MLPLLALAACGLDEPAGTPQSWPPPLGVTVESAAAADLDGDGIAELAVLSSGASSQAGAYFIRGDATIAGGGVPTAFATFAPLHIHTPAAATIASNQLVAAYSDGDNVEIARFDAHFAALGRSVTLGLAPSATVLWVAAAGSALLVGNGTAISYVPADGDETALTPRISPVVLATTYNDNGTQTIVVASAKDVETATLSSSGTLGAWSSARSGIPWLAQTAFDLDHDGQPEILGYDSAQHSLCALELTFLTTSCVSLAMPSTMDATSITVADVVAGPALDITIVFAGPTSADIVFLGDVIFNGALTATAQDGGNAPVAHAHPIAVARGPTHKSSLFLFAGDGTLACAACN